MLKQKLTVNSVSQEDQISFPGATCALEMANIGTAAIRLQATVGFL